ncbi:MAG: FAD-binding protein [Chitinophagaceae bacterium]|nr:FAD-binding protein [Chitinophagaceae bacterium]
MPKELSLKLLPHEAMEHSILVKCIAASAGVSTNQVTGFNIQKQSIDARSKTIWINLQVDAYINEPFVPRKIRTFFWKDVSRAAKRMLIIGAGPAGLFAALQCIECGIKPIILERGKDVRSRRRDLAAINKEGEINPESNYCFGEGGAGTYSDGKLYTRSSKRGDVQRILELLVLFGASENILYEAHPHIGTNKLPQIITAIRHHIIQYGGEIHFQQKVTDFTVHHDLITEAITSDGTQWKADAFLLATGHSARDIFELLLRKKILIEPKPFALGVRIEHPQALIDSCQYHLPFSPEQAPATHRSSFLPPASYSLVQQALGRGVFSFCMCPGGIIAPAATAPGEIVVNGWSPSKRNNPFANSGMVTEIRLEDLEFNEEYRSVVGINKEQLNSPLGMMYFQQLTERKAFAAGGGKLVAPAQRMEDFIQKKQSSSLPDCSYLPGIQSADVHAILPGFVAASLKVALMEFGKKMKGYRTNEAVLVATESRTSSPVRIPRLKETLHHPQIKNLYPCAEGAGYAGGIVSAAMDGEKIIKTAAVII